MLSDKDMDNTNSEVLTPAHYAVSLHQQCPTFHRITVPSTSGSRSPRSITMRCSQIAWVGWWRWHATRAIVITPTGSAPS